MFGSISFIYEAKPNEANTLFCSWRLVDILCFILLVAILGAILCNHTSTLTLAIFWLFSTYRPWCRCAINPRQFLHCVMMRCYYMRACLYRLYTVIALPTTYTAALLPSPVIVFYLRLCRGCCPTCATHTLSGNYIANALLSTYTAALILAPVLVFLPASADYTVDALVLAPVLILFDDCAVDACLTCA